MKDLRGIVTTPLGIKIPDGQPWWQSDLLCSAAVFALLLTLVALWLMWCMLRALCRALGQLSHPGAFCAVAVAVMASMSGLLLLVWWGFTQIFGHTPPRFTVAPLAPPMLWLVVHAASIFTTIGRVLVSMYLWVRTLVLKASCIFHLMLHCYKIICCLVHCQRCIVPHKAADCCAQFTTDLGFSQPLLDEARFPVMTNKKAPHEWAAALIDVMHKKDDSDQDGCAFDVGTNGDFYKNLEEMLKEDGRACLVDLLLFPMKYLGSLWTNMCRCFYRQLWIDNAMSPLRARQKEVAEEMERLASSPNTRAYGAAERRYQHWQVLEDQLVWYRAHSLVLVDVLALVTARDARMSRVVRLWKALDDAISRFLPRILFPRLWKPTPSVRRQSLLSRLGNVRRLAEGGDLMVGSPRDEGLEANALGKQLENAHRSNSSLQAQLAAVRSLVTKARQAGGTSPRKMEHAAPTAWCEPQGGHVSSQSCFRIERGNIQAV